MSEVFGRDLGLMHQVVLTGNRIGADRGIWGALAHNEELFSEVVELVRKALMLDDTDRATVQALLEKLDCPCPFEEEESYYHRTPHCYYWKFYDEFHNFGGMERLFWKGHNNKKVRPLCEAMDCYCVVCYVLSGSWCKVYKPKKEWMHDPLDALFITFPAIVAGNEVARAPMGKLVPKDRFIKNETVAVLESLRELHQCHFKARYENGTKFPPNVIENIYTVCSGVRIRLREKILAMIAG